MPRMRRPVDAEVLLGNDRRAPEYLEVLARGLRVLECFRDNRRALSVSDVGNLVCIPRASARRALLTLVSLGFVEAQGRAFALTPKVLTLASAYLSSNIVPTVMQPIVEDVALRVRQACSAAILDGDDVVFIARATPTRIVSVGLEIGFRLPASTTAVGRVLLSALPDGEVDAHLSRATLARHTERTLIDKKNVKAAIVAVRKSGFSDVDQEVELGFRSVAVPVWCASGSMSCALHIGTHLVGEQSDKLLSEWLPVLHEAADRARPMLI